MKIVRQNARFHDEKCTGCKTCAHVCPTGAFTLPNDRPLEKSKIAPCTAQCPIGNDIEGFMWLVGQKRYIDAYELLLKTNPFPGVTGRVCDAPCEEACNRVEFDEGVSIRGLERFVADQAMRNDYKIIKPRVVQRGKIAVVGSGPAGLSCAYRLGQLGYKVVVFEAEKSVGGMLRFGIPEYRLPKKILEWEIRNIQALNIKFQPNRRLGENLTFKQLKEFDACFISTGLQKSGRLRIAGENGQGVFTALDFLRNANAGRAFALGKRVAVIGGGNSAIDAARCALRLGSQPFILYRRSMEEMPAIPSERKELEREGIKVLPLMIPKRIIAQKGRIQQVECLTARLGEPGKDGRRVPVPIPGSEFMLDVDNVIVAVGELPDFAGLPSSIKLKKDKLIIGAHGEMTGKGVFAGGDVVTGAGTVAEAIASGMKGAMAMHRFLKKESEKDNGYKPEEVSFEELNPDYFYPARRVALGRIDSARAVKCFDEVRTGYEKEEALEEARRCFGCAAPPTYNDQDCRGCIICEQRCPSAAITIEKLERPFTIGIDPGEVNPDEILRLCTKAKVHPKQIICYCTNTAAEEIVAAILKGAKSVEAVSRMTGARTGCGIACIQSIIKLLNASGQTVVSKETPQYYAESFSLWDLEGEIEKKYEKKGYHFDEDRQILKEVFQKG